MTKNLISKLITKKKREAQIPSSSALDIHSDSDIDTQDESSRKKTSINDLNNEIEEIKDTVHEITVNMQDRDENLEAVRKRSDTITSNSSELFDKMDIILSRQKKSDKHWSFGHCNRKITFAVIVTLIGVSLIMLIGIVSS